MNILGITNIDLLVLVGASILMWFFGLFFAKRTINRTEGAFFVLCYVAYTVFLIYNA
jgi:cation:H+ antiporter